jgi:hypothetical protein
MSHLHLGRPLLKSLAFGSSVPEIDSQDIAHFAIVRLKMADENAIADLAEAAAVARAQADIFEQEIAQDATALIEQFLTV